MCKHIDEGLKTNGEPIFKTPNRVSKPDVILIKDQTAIVLDAQVVGDNADLNKSHQDKITKYKVLKHSIQERYSVSKVTFTSLTLSARGIIWCCRSFEQLVELNLLKRSDVKVISTRVLIGCLYAVNIFNKSTQVRRENGRGMRSRLL